MLKSSLNFNAAFEQPVRKIYARVTIGDKTYTEDDIYTIDFESGSLNSPGYQIGTVFSDYVNIVFDKLLYDIQELDKVIVELGIERETVANSNKYLSKLGKMKMGNYLNKIFYEKPIEYVRLGEFYINEHIDINENDKTTTISCMDAVIYLEGVYQANIDYPAYLFDISKDVCNQVGIPINEESFLKLPNLKVKSIEGYTHRQILGFIAQFVGGFIKFSKFGELSLKTAENSLRVIDSNMYYSNGLTKNDLRYKIQGLSVTNESYEEEMFVGSKKGIQLSIDNPFIENDSVLDIFNSIKDIEFYPFSLEWRGIPSVEAGDWLLLEDNYGNQFKVPNINYKLSYNGGLKATSSVTADAQPVEIKPYKNDSDRPIKNIAKSVVEVAKTTIKKDELFNQINDSENGRINGDKINIDSGTLFENNAIPSDALKAIDPIKITVGAETVFEDNSIPENALKELTGEKISFESDSLDGDILKELIASKLEGVFEKGSLTIDFDNGTVKSVKQNGHIVLENGNIIIDGAADVLQDITSAGKQNIARTEKNALLVIEETDIVEFTFDNETIELGFVKDSNFDIASDLLTEQKLSQKQLITTLFLAIKQLNEKIKLMEEVE